MTAISVSERLLEMAAFYTPLALTVTFLLKYVLIIQCSSLNNSYYRKR